MAAKVSLSAFEMQLVTDKQWILTKNAVIQKVYQLFGDIAAAYSNTAQLQLLPVEIIALPPKISKGENYKGLPYVMLDYPRCFGREDVFAVRTFFWWGYFFTVTLHLKGKYKVLYQDQLMHAVASNIFDDAFINNSNEEWEHDIHAHTIQPAGEVQMHAVNQLDILKLIFKLDLNEWNDAEAFCIDHFQQLLKVITG